MRTARAHFKLALRECRLEEDRLRTEALARKLTDNDAVGFWNDVKKINPRPLKLTNTLDRVTGESDILSLWYDKYSKLYNSVDANANHDELLHLEGNYEFVTVETLIRCLDQLPKGKSAGVDGVPAEVLQGGSHRLRVLLAMFINACLCHCWLPPMLMRTILIPLIKDRLKPASDSDNYRLIAIASSFSKLFELIILSRCENLLHTTDNQFGFKKKHGTDLCIYLLKDVINYYNVKGSPVYCCFLDLRKAFDRVNFKKLFQKLINRNVPPYIVKLLVFWYTNQEMAVRWGNLVSTTFKVTNGLRQGGILSPGLFNVYVDLLSENLNGTRIGCYAGSMLINHLSYADDMVLLAPSAQALRRLLKTCEEYAKDYSIIYNTDKTKCMICWPKSSVGEPVFALQGVSLELVQNFKYLGVIISTNMTDDAELTKKTRGIYASGNSMISSFKSCSTVCKTAVFRTYMSSIYCIALWCSYSVRSYAKAKVAHNDILRSLFRVPRYASASALFVHHNLKNLDVIRRNAMYNLMTRLLASPNSLVRAVCRSEVRVQSRIWHHWSVSLGLEWNTIMAL